MKRLFFSGALALAVLSTAVVSTGASAADEQASGGASPAEKSGRRALRRSCRDDYQRLCNGIRPGGGQVVACLKDHVADLTPACHQALGDAGLLGADGANATGK